MTKSLPLLCFLYTGIPILYGQTDQQLRDPEYLVEQYNQLVAKHNALIEKTRVIISDRTQASEVIETTDPRIQMKLNEALAKASALETQLNRIKQEELRTNTSNQYLDDTNARLRRQLQELKADEKEILQRNKHPHPLIYLRGFKSEDLVAILDFLYFGKANVYQENLDSFLAMAEELKLKVLTDQTSSDLLHLHKKPANFKPDKKSNEVFMESATYNAGEVHFENATEKVSRALAIPNQFGELQ